MKKMKQTIKKIIAPAMVFSLGLAPMMAAAQSDIFGSEELPGQFEGSTDTASGLLVRALNILLALVGLVAVFFLVWGAFKYITSQGNQEDSGAAKKTMLNAIIGLVIVLLAFALVRIVANAVLGGAI